MQHGQSQHQHSTLLAINVGIQVNGRLIAQEYGNGYNALTSWCSIYSQMQIYCAFVCRRKNNKSVVEKLSILMACINNLYLLFFRLQAVQSTELQQHDSPKIINGLDSSHQYEVKVCRIDSPGEADLTCVTRYCQPQGEYGSIFNWVRV